MPVNFSRSAALKLRELERQSHFGGDPAESGLIHGVKVPPFAWYVVSDENGNTDTEPREGNSVKPYGSFHVVPAQYQPENQNELHPGRYEAITTPKIALPAFEMAGIAATIGESILLWFNPAYYRLETFVPPVSKVQIVYFEAPNSGIPSNETRTCNPILYTDGRQIEPGETIDVHNCLAYTLGGRGDSLGVAVFDNDKWQAISDDKQRTAIGNAVAETGSGSIGVVLIGGNPVVATFLSDADEGQRVLVIWDHGSDQPFVITANSATRICDEIGLQPGSYRGVLLPSSSGELVVELDDPDEDGNVRTLPPTTETGSTDSSDFAEGDRVVVVVGPDCRWWIEANYPETTTDHLKEGAVYPATLREEPTRQQQEVQVELAADIFDESREQKLGAQNTPLPAIWWAQQCAQVGDLIFVVVINHTLYAFPSGLNLYTPVVENVTELGNSLSVLSINNSSSAEDLGCLVDLRIQLTEECE